jgi:hypothetical protein
MRRRIMNWQKDCEVYIHVGLHKTATSFLQRNVFPNIPEIAYMKEFFITTPIPEHDKILISSEGLSGVPYINDNAEIQYIIANRLSRIFDNANVIIGIRDKEDWKKSLYKQYIRVGGTLSFLQWSEEIFDDNFLDFERYICFLKNKFNRVHIFDFEKFKKNNDKEIEKMCKFIGVEKPEYYREKVNIGLNEKEFGILKNLNKIQKSSINPDGAITLKKNYLRKCFELYRTFKKNIMGNKNKKGYRTKIRENIWQPLK